MRVVWTIIGGVGTYSLIGAPLAAAAGLNFSFQSQFFCHNIRIRKLQTSGDPKGILQPTHQRAGFHVVPAI